MATLPKLKVYENGGMIQFATLTDELITSEPKGTVRIKKSGEGFSFEHVITGAPIAAVVNFADILDSAGAAYGADFDAVLTALSFFFEVAPVSAMIDFPYATGRWQSFTDNYDTVTSRSLDVNTLLGYQILIRKQVSLTKISGRFITANAGASVVGVYSSDSTTGAPANKILQSATPFNNASLGAQQVDILGGGAFVVAPGLYWVTYLSSSTPTLAAVTQNTLVNASGFNSTMALSNNVWFRSLAYNATLPSVAGAGTYGNYGNSIPFFTFLNT